MSFKKDDLKQKLLSKKTIFGTCITVYAPRWPKLIADAGLDFIFIDLEHMALDRSELSHMCQTYLAFGLSPVVRILKPDPGLAGMAMDAGAVGVVAPYMENVEEVKNLIGATKFRPLKGEKLTELIDNQSKPSKDLKKYIDRYNEGHLCILNIESLPAVHKLDELLTIKGVDGVFIGPHDLSVNMGIPEQYDHPDFIKTVKLIIQKSRKYTMGVGIHFSTGPERQLYWIKQGVNIVLHSSDMALFSQHLRKDMALLKGSEQDQIEIQSDDSSITI